MGHPSALCAPHGIPQLLTQKIYSNALCRGRNLKLRVEPIKMDGKVRNRSLFGNQELCHREVFFWLPSIFYNLVQKIQTRVL
jgi:hypothetical protein